MEEVGEGWLWLSLHSQGRSFHGILLAAEAEEGDQTLITAASLRNFRRLLESSERETRGERERIRSSTEISPSAFRSSSPNPICLRYGTSVRASRKRISTARDESASNPSGSGVSGAAKRKPTSIIHHPPLPTSSEKPRVPPLRIPKECLSQEAKVLRFSDNSSRRSASAFLASLAPSKSDRADEEEAGTGNGKGENLQPHPHSQPPLPDPSSSDDGASSTPSPIPDIPIRSRWGLRVGEIVWAKMRGAAWWPAQIFAFNAGEEETCVLWLGSSTHGFVGGGALEPWVAAFSRRYNRTRKAQGYQVAVAEAIRRHAGSPPSAAAASANSADSSSDPHSYYQGLAPAAVRALAKAS